MARYSGRGAQIAVRTAASPETYTPYVQVTSFGGVDFTSDEIDVTVIEDEWNQFIQGNKDAGSLPIELIFDPNESTHNAGDSSLLNLFKSGEVRPWRIRIPSSPAWYFTFEGYIQNFALGEFSGSSPITASGQVRVQGNPAFVSV